MLLSVPIGMSSSDAARSRAFLGRVLELNVAAVLIDLEQPSSFKA